MKKGLYLFLLLILIPVGIFSKGQTEESDYKEVTGKENWEYEVPIADKKPGKYNLLIRAKDKAENESFAGPFDIYVDPESDKPIVSITNPSSLMRVGGVLNIVGTARDDDAIEKVLLKINDGEFFEANGKEFWNYTLAADVLEDGQHTITAKAVDINGLEGYEVSVIYNQDTIKPVNTIENYKNGVVFAGKVNILGKVVDANGIGKLEVSVDNQLTYESIKFDKEKDEDFYTFSMDIDTNKLTDGPNIYWFKSQDKTGSVGYTAFLFFVDNMGPEAVVLDPVPEESLNGIVTVSGKISDIIGVKSFKYVYGDEEGEIELLPGNPYWTQSFNLLNENNKEAKIKFISEDTSGNIAVLDYEIPIDKLGDKPVLFLDHPVEGGKYKDELVIEGYILDDDYIDGVTFKVDGEDIPFVKTFNSFSHHVEGLSSGSHKLTITAKDSDSILGDYIEVPFEIEKYSPNIMINSVSKSGEESLYYPGIEVTTDGDYQILGSVSAGNNISSLAYKLNGREYKDIKWTKGSSDSIYLFSIDIDESFDYGAISYSIKAVDNYGNETVEKSLIYVKNYTVINEDWGLFNVATEENKNITVSDSSPFEAYFNGPDIKSVSIQPENDVVSVNFKGKVISVKPKNNGITEKVKIVAETDKGFFETKEFKFIVDNKKPVIELDRPSVGTSQAGNLKLSGTISDISLVKLEYRFSNQTEYKPLKWSGSGDSKKFNTNLDIPETDNETLSIELRAVDELGNINNFVRSFNIKNNSYIQELTKDEIDNNKGKSSDKPELFINYPLNNQVMFTEPVLSGFTRDDDKVRELKITDLEEGGKSRTIAVTGLFDINIKDFGTGKKNLEVVSIDKNGIESSVKKIIYNYQPNRSSIMIDSINEIGSKSDFYMGTLITSEDGVTLNGTIKGSSTGEVTYSFGDSYFKAQVDGDKFTIPVPKDIKWGQNNISVVHKDNFGRKSYYNSFFYIVDKNKDKKVIDKDGIYFNDSRVESDYINLSGKESFNGHFKGREIKEISLDSRIGEVPGFLNVKNNGDRVIISSSGDGFSKDIRVIINTIDGDIYYSDYYKFVSDDKKPEIRMDTSEQSFIQNSLIIQGSFYDELKPHKMLYSLNSGTSWIPLELKEPEALIETEEYTKTSELDSGTEVLKDLKEFVFKEEVDFSNKEDGGYSVWFKAEDLAGNEAEHRISFIKDSTDPEVSLFVPGVDEVNGTISIIGKAKDNIELETIEYSKDGEIYKEVGTNGVFSFFLNFGEDEIFPETFTVRAKDKSGNIKEIYPVFNINQEKDKPVVQIQTPVDGEIIRNDFVISGMAFDDDGVDTIYYSLDGGDLLPVVKNANNFSLNIPLETIANNEHIITVKAVDILGVESDVMTSTFWVSKEEPESKLVLPAIEDTKRDTIKLAGTSFDKNGIGSVYVSTDNGVSYQKAQGEEDWNYTFNTKNIKDGTYSIFIKAIDKLNTPGFYSTLINIDNTAPELIINEPYDGDILSDKIVFSGRSLDNIGLQEVKYRIYTHSEDPEENIVVGEGALSKGGIFNIEIPLDGYELGEYNIELIAYDLADNRSISTRNFTVTESESAGDLEQLFPQPGSVHTSVFEVAGRVLGRKTVSSVQCYIDDNLFSDIKVDEFNYFNLKVDTLNLEEGEHSIKLMATLPDGQVYETALSDFFVQNTGPWLKIVNMKTGDNISGRPYLVGEAGYIQDTETPKDELVSPDLVEVSLDNGQVFNEAQGRSRWEFRVETWQYDDGLTPILVRCHYSNGEIKTSRIAVNIDRSKPEVGVLEDLEQGRFNESISISGIASDSNGLTDISVVLREGDKGRYEVPGLFQGMFFDVETSFGKIVGGGVGLTFFDDNVKIQFTAGETRPGSDTARIKGLYYGGKLIANLYTMEFGALLGPDWDFFSMSLGVGASFTQKTITIGDQEERMWFSSIISQLELAKIKLDSDVISSISLYCEFEATLLSAENQGGFVPHIGVGSRVTLF